MRKLIFLLIFISVALWRVSAQTKIAIPPTTIEFSKIGQKSGKTERKQLKVRDRIKNKKEKELKSFLQKNTDLENEEVDKYLMVISSLDSARSNEVQQDLYALGESRAQDHEKYKNQAHGIKRSRSKYKRDSLNSNRLKEKIPSRDELKMNQFVWQLDSTAFDSTLSALDIPSPDSSVVTTDYAFVKDSISRSNIDDLTANERIKSKLESVVQEEIGAQELGAYEGTGPLVAPVKQYISGLEKFNFEKPQIPKEKLGVALMENQKQRKLDELKNGLLPNVNKSQSYETDFIRRFEIGGYFQYDPSRNRINLTPTISYCLTEKLRLGIGYNTSIALDKNDSLATAKGYRIFTDYEILGSYFLHLESEWQEQNDPNLESGKIRQRNTYLGIGRSIQYKFVRSSVLVLYNFNAPSEFQNKKFTIRLGLTISK